jgi:hypothetical protein
VGYESPWGNMGLAPGRRVLGSGPAATWSDKFSKILQSD